MTKLIHAIERAIERVGVALSLDDLRGMVRKIEEGHALRLADAKGGMEQHVVTWNGVAFRVVYSPRTKKIVTVLPRIGSHRAKACKPMKSKNPYRHDPPDEDGIAAARRRSRK